MTLTIRFASDVRLLARHLAAALESVLRERGDPFAPVRVIVPNANLGRWLQLFLARPDALGVCANIRFPFLEEALQELLSDGNATGDSRVLDRHHLRWAVCAALLGGSGHEELEPLLAYCRNPAGEFDPADPACARRLWRLSGRLAGLFREYEYHRCDLVEAWLADTELSSHLLPLEPGRRDGFLRLERAQRALFRRGYELVRQAWPEARSLFGLARETSVGQDASADAGPVFFFGLSQISRFHCRLLHALAGSRELVMYHFNPCVEYWEDARTPAERWRAWREVEVDAQGGLELEIENELLSAWGRAGRETVKLLADLDEEDADGRVLVEWLDDDQAQPPAREDAEPSVLRALQQGIRRRSSALPRLVQDRSLQVMAAPSRQREVEAVYESILASVLDGGVERTPAGPVFSLAPRAGRLTDIAVLVPDMALYRPVLVEVFSTRGDIPFNLVDTSAARESMYAAAFLDLLALATGEWSRRQVLELAANPCFQAGSGIADAEVEEWSRWAESLGVFRCFDQEQRLELGLPPGARHTWEQGLARLRLGRIMPATADPAAPDAPPAVGKFADFPAYADMRTAGPGAERFGTVLERLRHSLRGLAARALPPREWSRRLARLADDFLAVPPDRPEEERVRAGLFVALQDLDREEDGLGLASLLAAGSTTGASQIPYALVCEALSDCFAGMGASMGRYLTGGVTIAELQPMRPIPFATVYVLGMEEGGLPRRGQESTLDLRQWRRRIGDVSRADADRYMFLETLMSAGSKLCLSYVCEDLRKDERRFPSSILGELERFASEHILASGDLRETRVTLAAADQALAGNDPAWSDLTRTHALEENLLARVHRGDTDDRLRAQLRELARDRGQGRERSRRARRLLRALQPAAGRDAADLAPPAPEPQGRARVDVRELANMLKTPLVAYARRHLGLGEEEETAAALAEHEPLSLEFPHDWSLLGAGVADYLRRGRDRKLALAELRRRHDRICRASLGPPTPYAPADLEARVQTLERLLDACQDLPPGDCRRVLLGPRAVYDPAPTHVLPPLVLDIGADDAVEVTGMQECVWLADDEVCVLRLGMSLPRQVAMDEKLLEPALFCLALAAAGHARALYVGALRKATRGGGKKPARRSPAWLRLEWERAAARAYLRELVRAYLDPGRPVFMPLALAGRLAATGELTRASLEQALERNELAGDYAAYRPSDLERLLADRVGLPADPGKLWQRWYAPIFDAAASAQAGGGA